MISLSDRLKTIAQKIKQHSRIADIGSDHAMLPMYLAKQNAISYAIAGEYNAGPLEASRRNVKQAGLEQMIDVRSGDGLSVIRPGEVDAITIAGMGGGLITRILDEGKEKLDRVQQLVLQPNVGEDIVRHWLFEHGWYLLEENILLEDNKIYEILHAVKHVDAENLNRELYDPESMIKNSRQTDENDLSQLESLESYRELISLGLITRDDLFRFGPHLLRQPSQVFIMKWEIEIDKLEKVCSRLAQSSLAQSKQKLQHFQDDITKLKEVLHCLQKDKPSYNGLTN